MAHRNRIILATVLVVAATSFAGTWRMSPGKGSHAAAGGGTPTFVEFANSAGSASSSTQTINLTVAAGATIVVGTKWEDAARSVTVTDGTNTYTPFTSGGTNAGGQVYMHMFYAKNVGAGSYTISVNYGAATAFVESGAYELSGCSASAPLDGEGTPGTDTSGDTPALVTGNVTTTQANTVLISFGGNYSGILSNLQASWTEDYDVPGFQACHRTVTSTGTYHGETDPVSTGGAEVVMFGAFK